MSIISERTIKEYLRLAKNIKGNHAFYDIHVHPLDIFTEDNKSSFSLKSDDLKFPNKEPYRPPVIGHLKDNENYGDASERVMNLCKRLTINKRYSKNNIQLFIDHMKLGLIDKIMLLPVPSRNGCFSDQLEYQDKFCKSNKKFINGGGISNSTKTDDIMRCMSDFKKKYNIKIIKIHPNVTAIDTTAASGKERIEAILSACNELKLPAIIHGGRSTLLAQKKEQFYGTIDNLKDIDWTINREKVVIAHAFCHDYNTSYIKKDIIPKLKQLCKKYENILFDLSNLEIDSITLLLNHINNDRIVFGSDALYEHQWAAVVKLLLSLFHIKEKKEEKFIKIISVNPSKHIFKENNILIKQKNSKIYNVV